MRCCLMLAVCAVLAGAAGSVRAADWLYTVRPTDNLWNLATKYCGSARHWSRIAKYNQLTSPHALTPGERIRIPVEWLIKQPVNARLTFVQGAVSHVPRNGVLQPAQAMAPIAIGDSIRTAADSYATITFADDSQLTLGPNTEVTMDELAAYGDTGMVDTRVRLDRGRSESTVTPARGAASEYRIDTPLGVAAVRGTQFRVRAEDSLFNETVAGRVGVAAPGGSATDVNAGFGVVAHPAASALVPEALLPAPTLLSTPVLTIGAAVRWLPIAGARSYLTQVYAPGATTQPLAQWPSQLAEVVPVALPPGTYTVGVRGIAQSGLEGMEALTGVELVLAPPKPIQARLDSATDMISFNWQDDANGGPYRVEIAATATFEDAERHNVEATQLNIPRPRAGHYYWRVARTGANRTSPASTFDINPATPTAPVVESSAQGQLRATWENVADATGFRVQIASDPAFKQLVLDARVVVPATSIVAPKAGTYYIRVQAVTAELVSPFSPITRHQVLRRPNWWIPGAMAALILAL